MKTFIPLMLLILLVTGCTPDQISESPGQKALKVSPDKLRNLTSKVLVAGSSTAAPLVREIAEDFHKEGFQAQLTIDTIGTDAGLQRFIKYGDTDLVLASRPISDEEVQAARETQREILSFTLAVDALTVAVPTENTFASDLSTGQLALLFTTANLWSDVNPQWPSTPVNRFILGNNSGSTDFFARQILGGDKTKLLSSTRTQLTEEDRILVHAVASTPGAVGFMGYPVWKNNQHSLKALAVAGITPGEASVKSGIYPLTRKLYLYTTASVLRHNLPAAWVLGYLFQNYSQLIDRSGFFPISSGELELNRTLWQKSLKEDS